MPLCGMQALGHRKKSAISHVPPVLPVSFSDLYAPLSFWEFWDSDRNFTSYTDAGLYIRTLSFICPFLYTNIALTSIFEWSGKNR